MAVTQKTGDTVIYHLGKSHRKEAYAIKAFNHPEYFRLPSYQATALLRSAVHKQLLNTSSDARTLTNGRCLKITRRALGPSQNGPHREIAGSHRHCARLVPV